MDWRASKINPGTKLNTHQPFKLHLFKAERLVSPTCYPFRLWMNPGAIMPKNSPIVDISQFSGDFRFTHPQEQVHPITPQGPGLLGTCPCRTPGPLAFGAAGHRWGPHGEQNADKAEPVSQQYRRRWCPGSAELRESRKKPGGEGDGAVAGRLTWWRVFGVWGRLWWSIFDGTLWGNWLNLVSRPWWRQCNRIFRQDQLRIPAFLCRRKFVGVPKATCLAILGLDVDEQC